MTLAASPTTEASFNSDHHSRHALVLYGSETGNAQSAAEELQQLVRRLHFVSNIQALDTIEPHKLNEYDLVLIVISTTGQGDLPRNAQLFWRRLLRKKLPPTALSGTKFGIFGIGDSSYPQFNYAALKLRKRIVQLGALEVVDKGEADEQHDEGSDTIFLPWKESLRQRLLGRYPLSPETEPVPENELLQPPWLLALWNSCQDQIITSQTPVVPTQGKEANAVTSFRVTLAANNRVTPDGHWQDVRHIILNADTAQPYGPGDILSIHPKNPSADVQQLVDMMGWDAFADQDVTIAANEVYQPVASGPPPKLHPHLSESHLPLKTLLGECIDLNAIPKRSFFSLIAHFTNDEYQKSRLLEFADPELTDELFDYTTRPRRSILEVLQEFDTVKIPWQWLFEVFPPLRGRQFSIASGGVLKETQDGRARFELLVAIVKYRTVIRKIRRGVCSRYLESLETGAALHVELIKGSLGITKAHASLPLLMIGPGTGVAPMRSLIWERRQWTQDKPNSISSQGMGHDMLLFGCRNENADYFFCEEWKQIKDSAPFEVHAAFSRDQQSKFYVQDLVIQLGDQIFELLHGSNGIVCVCGSSGKMPQAVRQALIDVFQRGLKCHRSDAEAYLKAMEKESRYKQETW